MDNQLSGLPHAVVKQAENSRVREVVKKIESHPHRQALQADLLQNNAYNPFSEKSKKMIKDMGTVELFELCETIPKAHCSECLLYWNQGTEVSSDGHWIFSQSRTMSLRKERPHGHRYGKTEEQRQHHIAHNLRKRASKGVLKDFTIAFRKI